MWATSSQVLLAWRSKIIPIPWSAKRGKKSQPYVPAITNSMRPSNHDDSKDESKKKTCQWSVITIKIKSNWYVRWQPKMKIICDIWHLFISKMMWNPNKMIYDQDQRDAIFILNSHSWTYSLHLGPSFRLPGFTKGDALFLPVETHSLGQIRTK